MIEIAHGIGWHVHETNLGLFDVHTADEVFVTGTAAEVAPITEIDGREIGDGAVGNITKKLMQEFEKLTQTDGTPI